MANRDFYLKGTDEQAPAVGNNGITRYDFVVDVADLVANTFNTTDVARLLEFEQGTFFNRIDTEIVATLSLDASAGAVDVGNTISSATDPDDYVDNQSTTAVGVFGTITAASSIALLMSADGYFAIRFTGDKLSDGTADATGKVAISIWADRPVKLNIERAKPNVYTNV